MKALIQYLAPIHYSLELIWFFFFKLHIFHIPYKILRVITHQHRDVKSQVVFWVNLCEVFVVGSFFRFLFIFIHSILQEYYVESNAVRIHCQQSYTFLRHIRSHQIRDSIDKLTFSFLYVFENGFIRI